MNLYERFSTFDTKQMLLIKQLSDKEEKVMFLGFCFHVTTITEGLRDSFQLWVQILRFKKKE